jgi:predicted Zn finger-like uncharacterized protein
VDCPSCDATYDIPDRLLVARRKVRCARCGVEWFPTPIAAPPEPAPPPPEPDIPEPAGRRLDAMLMPPEDNAMRQLARTAQAPSVPPALKAAWGASLAALVLLTVGVIVWRDAVVHVWPPSARLLGGAPTAVHQPVR